MFVFEFEICNDQYFAEAYAAGLYDVIFLGDMWDWDLTPDKIITEKGNVTVFDGSNWNPAMNLLEYISEKYERDEMTYFDKDGDDIISS